MTGTMFITGDADADRLLNTDGTAALIGMLLDQQVPMEWAFIGPSTLRARLGHLDATKIAAMSQDDFVAVCCAKPAIHRFPASMGRRIHDLCTALVERFDGRGEGVWAGVKSGDELYARPANAARLRRREGSDLRGHPRQALQGSAQGLAGRRWEVRRRHAAERRRHHRPGLAGQGPRMEEGRQGRPRRTSRIGRLAER